MRYIIIALLLVVLFSGCASNSDMKELSTDNLHNITVMAVELRAYRMADVLNIGERRAADDKRDELALLKAALIAEKNGVCTNPEILQKLKWDSNALYLKLMKDMGKWVEQYQKNKLKRR